MRKSLSITLFFLLLLIVVLAGAFYALFYYVGQNPLFNSIPVYVENRTSDFWALMFAPLLLSENSKREETVSPALLNVGGYDEPNQYKRFAIVTMAWKKLTLRQLNVYLGKMPEFRGFRLLVLGWIVDETAYTTGTLSGAHLSRRTPDRVWLLSNENYHGYPELDDYKPFAVLTIDREQNEGRQKEH